MTVLAQTAIEHLNVLAYRYLPFDGYGRYAISIYQALVRAGVRIHPALLDTLDMPGWMLRETGLDFSRLSLAIAPPHELRNVPGRVWNLTMYESTGIPEGWAWHANTKAERLIVPSDWLVEVFEDAGVHIPIHVIHGGVDPEEFPLCAPPPRADCYTFLAFGDRGSRKGQDIAWSAFYQAFGDQPDVRLVIKARPCNLDWLDLSRTDRRVSVWREDVASLREVFQMVDCFVFPTRGEGWGLPPREAACMGLPVITTRWGGTAVDIDHWAIPIDTVSLVPSLLHGDWAWPDVDEVAAHMRWCYEHRDEAYQKGQQAAQWLRDHQTWAHSTRALLDLVEWYG